MSSSCCRKITLEKRREGLLLSPTYSSWTHSFLWHPSQARTRPPIKMLFTAWEVSKAPVDSVSASREYFFLKQNHGWSVNSSCSLTVPAKSLCSTTAGWGRSSNEAISQIFPHRRVQIRLLQSHILALKYLSYWGKKNPTKFKQSSIMPPRLSTHVTDMVKIKWTNFLLRFPLFLFWNVLCLLSLF